MKWGRWLVLTVVLVLASPWLAAAVFRLVAAWLEPRYPPPGQLIPAGRHRLHLYCEGAGGSTVVLESGLGTSWVDWRVVMTQTARFARVCAYDRAGYGWSEPGPPPRSARRIAEELHAMLQASGERRPFVLVGHSFGALPTRIFASLFPGEVAGLVLVDASQGTGAGVPAPRQKGFFPSLGMQRVRRMWAGRARLPASLETAPRPFQDRFLYFSPPAQLETEAAELDAMPESERQAGEAVPPGTFATIILTAARDGVPARSIDRQRDLLNRLPKSQQILARQSGHFIQVDEPGLVVDAIREAAGLPRL